MLARGGVGGGGTKSVWIVLTWELKSFNHTEKGVARSFHLLKKGRVAQQVLPCPVGGVKSF